MRLDWGGDRVKVVLDRLEVLSLDLEGRPIAHTRSEGTYRRSLDGRVKLIWRPSGQEEGFHEARVLGPSEVDRWQGEVKERLEMAWDRLGGHPALEPARQIVLSRDAHRFRRIFGSVPILPPDQYRALVLQLSQGCSYNGCTFCNLYKDRSFQVKTPEEFVGHLRQAAEYFGRALAWRRGIFLGEGNAGNLPAALLEEALLQVRREFPSEGPRHPLEFDRVSLFLDTFTSLRPADEWGRLRELGLATVNIGMESGSRDVLRWIRKPGHPRRVEELVANLKAAGLRVHVIVLSGVGGRRFAEPHVRESVASLNRMPLGPQDRIYLSEFLSHPGSDYERRAAEEGIPALERAECREQTRALRQGLRFPPAPAGPWISLYDVRQFAY